jgi:hypothetical protein
MLYESGEYELARPLLEECINKFYEYSSIDYHPFVGAITLYAAVNIGLGNIDYADTLFFEACDYVLKKAGPESAEINAVQSQAAASFRKFKCFKKAEFFYRYYIYFLEGRGGKRNDSVYAITLSDLGGLYMEWNKLDKAEDYFK